MTLIQFESVPIKESSEPLVDLSEYDFIIEPMYYNQGLSKDNKMLLREGVVKKLLEIQTHLKNYKFKIWDGYRSREVQNNLYQNIWNDIKKKNPDWTEEKLEAQTGKFVTIADNKKRIPPHSTGGSVDLTLVDLSGRELDMGTSFDNFGPEASALYYDENRINDKIRNNRKILREAMTGAGFRQDKDEWWHYDYGNQTWALVLKKPCAIYGEVENYNLKGAKNVC